MITIQSAMLVSLGFLLATLMALVLAPAYRARAVRLTTDRLKRIMPLSEEEIRAEKDRVRTQYALRVHELEKQLERAKLSGARQQVELNRRDARITGLDDELSALKADLEQHVNARRVLEQTVVDRVPAIEQRLAEAKALLFQRDRELAAVSGDTGKTVRALDEALQANAHQRAEIERLTVQLGARPARPALITSSEAAAMVSDGAARKAGNGEASEEPAPETPAPANSADGSEKTKDGVARLSETIAEQAARICQLEAALAVFEQGEAGKSVSLKDSKIAMRSKIASLQAEVDTQAAAIHRLRAELASANERVALQSAQFFEEMRKLGTAGGSSRRSAAPAPRRSLAERIGEAQPALANALQPVNGPASTPIGVASTKVEDGSNTATASGTPIVKVGPGTRDGSASEPAASEAEQQEAAQGATEKAPEPKKTRLMDRIAGLSEP